MAKTRSSLFPFLSSPSPFSLIGHRNNKITATRAKPTINQSPYEPLLHLRKSNHTSSVTCHHCRVDLASARIASALHCPAPSKSLRVSSTLTHMCHSCHWRSGCASIAAVASADTRLLSFSFAATRTDKKRDFV
ncbi:hypothetical protein E2542_SST25380 [Spatholobus suberectus]|nr:hypothetical protein E2542_SST25380 [Spatholobus suberectus]